MLMPSLLLNTFWSAQMRRQQHRSQLLSSHPNPYCQHFAKLYLENTIALSSIYKTTRPNKPQGQYYQLRMLVEATQEKTQLG